MRPGVAALKSSSSNRWLARQARDPFVRARTEGTGKNPAAVGPALRARSSFKLADLAGKYPTLLRGSVVDLGAAPGGWSQVAAARRARRVVAVDLLPMEPIPGVDVVTGDFFEEDVKERVRELLRRGRGSGGRGAVDGDGGKETKESENSSSIDTKAAADTVLSDMMAAMSGVRVRDVQASLDLVAAATGFAHEVLRPADGEYGGGSLVLKFFLHPDLLDFRRTELDPCFSRVVTEKPKASRSESSEAYWVCLGYKGRPEP